MRCMRATCSMVGVHSLIPWVLPTPLPLSLVLPRPTQLHPSACNTLPRGRLLLPSSSPPAARRPFLEAVAGSNDAARSLQPVWALAEMHIRYLAPLRWVCCPL